MENTEKTIELFKKDPFIGELYKLIESKGYFEVNLVGGAVVDILMGVKPKDYDFENTAPIQNLLLENGGKFLCATKHANTYQFKGHIIQVLERDKSLFEYTISQSTFKIRRQSGTFREVISFDEVSMESKILIPTSFTNVDVVYDCLARMPHWKRKGFELPEATYHSLLETLSGNQHILSTISS
jgi:hypothetical protein